jgi:endoglucanase Acf2
VRSTAINGKHYGLFGPGGSNWQGIGAATLTNVSTKSYFSLAVLPENTEETLALFTRYAHAHVSDTRVAWSYDSKTSEVTTTFSYTTSAQEGKQEGTLFALYPHQWRHSAVALLGKEYPSVRGKMKLGQGTEFSTKMRFSGVLPALPNVGACDKQRLEAYLKAEVEGRVPAPADTYADGKWLGRTASLVPLAEQHQLDAAAQVLRDRLRKRLEQWLGAVDSQGKPKDRELFYYNERWGTLIGYPASFGTTRSSTTTTSTTAISSGQPPRSPATTPAGPRTNAGAAWCSC